MFDFYLVYAPILQNMRFVRVSSEFARKISSFLVAYFTARFCFLKNNVRPRQTQSVKNVRILTIFTFKIYVLHLYSRLDPWERWTQNCLTARFFCVIKNNVRPFVRRKSLGFPPSDFWNLKNERSSVFLDWYPWSRPLKMDFFLLLPFYYCVFVLTDWEALGFSGPNLSVLNLTRSGSPSYPSFFPVTTKWVPETHAWLLPVSSPFMVFKTRASLLFHPSHPSILESQTCQTKYSCDRHQPNRIINERLTGYIMLLETIRHTS